MLKTLQTHFLGLHLYIGDAIHYYNRFLTKVRVHMDIKGMKQFEEEVINSKMPVVIDFWAPWCGPCRFYSPIIDAVAEEQKSKLKLVKINVDENEEIAAKYYISSIPTTFLFEEGKPKADFVGAVPKETLEKWLSENL